MFSNQKKCRASVRARCQGRGSQSTTAALVRVARVAVNKVGRDCGVVQQEGDRVDQQHRGDDRLVGIGWGHEGVPHARAIIFL
jgi:hypothetical protein